MHKNHFLLADYETKTQYRTFTADNMLQVKVTLRPLITTHVKIHCPAAPKKLFPGILPWEKWIQCGHIWYQIKPEDEPFKKQLKSVGVDRCNFSIYLC